MRPNAETPAELDTLLRGARVRVLSIVGIVLTVLAWISSNIPFSRMTPDLVLPVGFWLCGCVAIAALGLFWYRSRDEATIRLNELFDAGRPCVQTIETVHLHIEHVIPFGSEMSIVLDTGERLAFGYWTADSCKRLEALLAPLRIVQAETQK